MYTFSANNMRTVAIKRKRSFDASPAAIKRRRTEAIMRRASRQRILTTPETKYFDVGIATAVTAAAANWADTEVPADNYVNTSGVTAAYTDSCLLPTAIGSGYGQANGNRYKLKKIRVKGHLEVTNGQDQADVGGPVHARLLMVMDTQPNGAQAQGEDVMQDLGAIDENGHSFQRVADTSGRFRILKDKSFLFNPTTSFTDGVNTGSVGFEGKQFKFTYKPAKPIQVNIKSGNATPTVAGVQSHNIFLLLFGSRTGAQRAINIYAGSRCYYCD